MRRPTVKERILLHLFEYTRYADAYEVPIEITQEGLATAAGIQVSHISQYVRPLRGEGVVEERTSHIVRRSRRRKVYFLTPEGRKRVSALRASLLGEDVPFRRSTGETAPVPLMKVYLDERRGAPLLQLVDEALSGGGIAQAVEVEVTPLADFTQEAPRVDRFYGRTKELEAVLRAVDEKPMVVVSGFAGIGKTTLGAKVCETLRGSRPVFWRQIRPWDTGTDLATRLATFLKALGRTGLHSLLSLSDARELSRVEELLATDLADLRPVLFFDDFHHASEDAEAFLSVLARVLRTRRGTAAVFLSRTTPRFYGRREVRLEGSVMELALEGLDRKSSAALLLDAGVPAASLKELTQASGGNPLFLQLFGSRGAQEAVARGWDTVATYIADEIEPTLEESERGCLLAASFYDIPVPASGLLLRGAADTRPLVRLQRKGLLGQVASGRYILHDTLKEYFHQGLAPEPMKALRAEVVAWLLEQAEQAARRGDPDEGLAYLGNAAKLEADRIRWASIMERIGDLRLLANHVAEAERSFHPALGEAAGPQARARLHEKDRHGFRIPRSVRRGPSSAGRGPCAPPGRPHPGRGSALDPKGGHRPHA
jgi:DNA-binding MarR family transcriptional regulator